MGSKQPTFAKAMTSQSWILHIDGDAFFASCEVSRRPDLFGKPVVVGEERGIATALTYQAKALGIKRGDPIFKIKREYPNVTILSSHFELYRKFAKNLAEILYPFVDEFEAYSIDECFATVTGNIESVQKQVFELKTQVQRKLGITYSFGVSITKTLAKIASKKNKPNGICFLMDQETITKALQETSAESIWGVGWSIGKKLKRHKIVTAYEFINSDLGFVLGESYTKPVFLTKDELCGNMHFQVGGDNPHKKSIQSTRTFLQKTSDKSILNGELSRNVEVACSELRRNGLKTNRVYFFLKPYDKGVRYIEKVFGLPEYTNSEILIMRYVERLFDEFQNTSTVLYKKSGVTMLNLLAQDEIPEDLFNSQEKVNTEEYKITSLIDGLRNKYGFGVISLASSLDANKNRKRDYINRHRADVYESGLPYPFLGLIY